MPYRKNQSFLLATVHCIITSFLAGIAISVMLSVIVMLMSEMAHASVTDETIALDSIEISQPADVTHGSLLFRNNGNFLNAPMLSTEVHITVTGMIARARVIQRFKNPGKQWKEGIYVFPLPENAAVDHLRMVLGERIIEGQIREREQAKREYNQAKASGKKASLVEQERPNIFTTSVANIAPGEEISIEIEYQHLVNFDNGVFSLRFPMVVAPRYIPGNTRVKGFDGSGWALNTDQVADASRITPPVLHPDKGSINPVSINVTLNSGFNLEHITSSYHNIDIAQQSPTQWHIKLQQETTAADRDFELIWKPDASTTPRAAFFNESVNNSNYGLIMLLPPAKRGKSILAREVIFVIDTSGSMAGTSIKQARAALLLALQQLKSGDRFNIIEFNSMTDTLFASPQPFTPETLNAAKSYVNDLRARGGTEMLPALDAALMTSEQVQAVRQIIFITDGSIGNEQALFNTIQQKLGNSRLFTVGIGSAPNSYFMSQAAHYGRGTYTYIGKIDEVHEKMSQLFAKLESPVLTNLQIDSGNQVLENYPTNIPDLYLGEPLILTWRAQQPPDHLNITGKIAGQVWHAEMNLQQGTAQSGISGLWARNRIAALTDQLHHDDDSSVHDQIVETALTYHLVSQFTSLIAVDITPSRPADAALESGALPVNLPHGWEYEKVFGQLPRTATSAELNLMIGLVLMVLFLLTWLLHRYVDA